MDKILLKIDNISKQFPGVKALDKINMNIKAGEVHSVVGENGAGKTTLMNIIMGVIEADEGEMFFDDNLIKPQNPHEAQNLGIGIVPQELNIVPQITVAENILLGTEIIEGDFSRVDWNKVHKQAKKLVELLNIDVKINEITSNLSPAQQQLVQIARIIALDCDLIIMDEPTTSLTLKEVETLFSIINELKSQGKTILFISHKFDEVFEISDRITVLRNGKYIVTKNVVETNQDEIIKYMVGREVSFKENKFNYNIGDNILKVNNLSDSSKIKNVSCEVKKGEIVGFAGLVGAGRTELLKAVYGASDIESGEIIFDGERVKINSPKEAMKLGMGFIPEERRSEALLPIMSVKSNITLPIINSLTNKLSFIKSREEKMLVEEYVDELKIETPNILKKIKYLSGGNQQKVILARWLVKDCKLIIFDEPTKGIDVGSKEEIYQLIRSLAESGKGVIVVSSEFPELFSLTNRIYVMDSGMIINEYETQNATKEKILNCILKNK